MPRFRFLPFLLTLLFVTSTAFAAEIPAAAVHHDLEDLRAAGWEAVGPDLYQRVSPDRTETLAYGDAGLRFELGWVNRQIATLEEALARGGSVETQITLHDLEELRETLVTELGATARRLGTRDLFRSAPEADQAKSGCLVSISTSASAGPGTNGPYATASASFYDDCYDWGEVYCYSYADGELNGVFNSQTQSAGPWSALGQASCNVSASVDANGDCYSRGYARVRTYDDLNNLVTYFDQEINQDCRPLEVTVSGVQTITIPYGECTPRYPNLPEWQVTSNLVGTSYSWTLDGSYIGSGTSVVQYFCSIEPYTTITVTRTIQVTGTNGGQTDTDSMTFDIVYIGEFGDP